MRGSQYSQSNMQNIPIKYNPLVCSKIPSIMTHYTPEKRNYQDILCLTYQNSQEVFQLLGYSDWQYISTTLKN